MRGLRIVLPVRLHSFDHTGQDKVSDVGKMAKGNGHLRGRARSWPRSPNVISFA